jgi:hypothetical protein
MPEIPLPASKTGEWRLIFGRYINRKEDEDEAACYRNYDDDSGAGEQESRRAKEEKLKVAKKIVGSVNLVRVE